MRSIFAICLIWSIASLCAAAPANQTLNVVGSNPGGGPYKGSLSINTVGNVSRMTWQVGSTSTGLGVWLGDTLAVAVGGDECAVVGYEINPEGGLDGIWAAPGATAAGREQATPGVGTTRGLAGDYVINGTNPEGERYRGALSVFKEADHWRFSWRTGTNFEGYGIERNGRIAVAWGAATCGVVLYDVDANGNLDGIWKYRDTAEGTETARR